MSKFVIECPNCGRYAEASSGFLGFFATKKINCDCGYVIDVKTEKVSSRTCPHCGNNVVFDQSEGEKALCPVCHEKINTNEMKSNLVEFSCPSCSCGLSADKNAELYICPLCDTEIDVQKQVKKESLLKDGLASVIKFEGDTDTIIWKHPIEDFNMGSQLIVHGSQEAIFFRDGKALDLFGAGRYTLDTFKLPMMEKIYQLPTDTEKTFHSEVYYINLAQHMALRWGTSEKITLIDPTSKAPISIGARGMFNFRVSDSRKLLLKLVGTTNRLDRNDIFGNSENSKHRAKDYFKSIVSLGVATRLAEIINSNNIDILQIDQQKIIISNLLKQSLSSYFDDYGIEITEFLIEGIVLPVPGELGYDTIQTLIRMRQAGLKKDAIKTETDVTLAEMDAKKNIDVKTESNKVEVENARREAVAAKGQTEVMQTQIEGQKKLVSTQADVEAEKMKLETERLKLELEMQKKAQTAQIEAEEMRAKGYSQKDVIQGQVLTAFAENQPSESGMNMSGIAGQALNMGAGFATMGAMAGMAGSMLGTGVQVGKEMTGQLTGSLSSAFTNSDNNFNTTIAPGGFNLNNTQMKNDLWNCNLCGTQGISSKFCPECGAKKPEPQMIMNWDCPSCGQKGISSKFCPECGTKRPETKQETGWNCPSCGTKGINSSFCPECGTKKPQEGVEEL